LKRRQALINLLKKLTVRGSRRLSENGYFPQSRRQAQILILEILQCIPAVKIFAFLDLGENLSFSDSLVGGKIKNAVEKVI